MRAISALQYLYCMCMCIHSVRSELRWHHKPQQSAVGGGEEEFNAVMSINVNGTANVIRHAVPLLLQARQGAIVNFSSGWGRSAAAEVGQGSP